jgi:hypothetical protein
MVPAVPTAHAARQRGGGHAAAHRLVLARSVIALYTRMTPIQFLIRIQQNASQPQRDSLAPKGDSIALARTVGEMEGAYRFARIGLSATGLLSTVLYAAAIWYGLGHIDAYWKRILSDRLPPLLNRFVARSHYCFVPAFMGMLWVYLWCGRPTTMTALCMLLTVGVFILLGYLIHAFVCADISRHLPPERKP